MRKITVKISRKKYPVLIGENIIHDAGTYIKKIFPTSKAFIITDGNVHKLYGETLKHSLDRAEIKHDIIILPAGEEIKSLDTAGKIYSELALREIRKTDLIIAFGGGTVGDVAGFCASSYLRGVNLVHIPTTLLAQADSSIGGKNAINLGEGKNLAGYIYQPKMVISDTNFLLTLTDDDFASGMAEIIKIAAVFDKNLFTKIKNNCGRENIMKIIDEIIFISCRIKAEIVAKDESDKKSRMMLNFGHTLAHALEKLPENKLSHGQAVAIGMISFAMAGEKLKITEQNTADEIEKTLTAFGLPCETSFDRQNVVALIKRDKKIRDGKLNIILLKKIGKAVIYPILINDIGDFL